MTLTDQVGHTAKALLFDDGTVLIPFTQRELGIVHRTLCSGINRLKCTGDFPEETEYIRIYNNLLSASFLVSPANKP